jgi:integrase/recombinase XerD
MNPAREVKTERFSRTEGKTPAFVEGEVQKLLGTVETSTHAGLRDRALLGVLAYTFARIGAVVNLKVEDYYPSGKRFLLRFREKGGKEKELPVHHKLEELLDEYLKATGLEKEPQSPLFPAALGKTGKLSRRPLVRTDAADMLKRRLKRKRLTIGAVDGVAGFRRLVADSPSGGREFSDSIDGKIGQARKHRAQIVANW